MNSDCSHEIRRWLLLGRKAMTNLDCALKSRDITLLTKFCIVKATVFPVVTYGCESWIIKKAERQNSWESLGQWGHQASQSSGKSTLNTHWKDWCWNWSSSLLITWCEKLTHWNSLWCWEGLRAEKEDIRGWYNWMASPMQWTWIWANSRRWWGIGRPGVLWSMGPQRVRHNWATEQQPLFNHYTEVCAKIQGFYFNAQERKCESCVLYQAHSYHNLSEYIK